jgi:hypothetical protein
MIIFLAAGRLGNQIFQFSFLEKISRQGEILVCFNMDSFFKIFDTDKKRVRHSSNPYIVEGVRKFLVPFVIRPLYTLRLISFVEQKKTAGSLPLPEWIDKKGLISSIRYVNTDYFQAEEFLDPAKVLDLRIKEEFCAEARQFLSRVPENTTKVFVHVRRGDYLRVKFLGECGIDLPKPYFERAIRLMMERFKNPFFIFLSDDPSFVEYYFREFEPQITSKNSIEVDLAIMTMCEAGIISNSSFSWWGAYLMRTRKRIIAPKYWYGWKQKIESHIGIQPTFAEVIDFSE